MVEVFEDNKQYTFSKRAFWKHRLDNMELKEDDILEVVAVVRSAVNPITTAWVDYADGEEVTVENQRSGNVSCSYLPNVQEIYGVVPQWCEEVKNHKM